MSFDPFKRENFNGAQSLLDKVLAKFLNPITRIITRIECALSPLENSNLESRPVCIEQGNDEEACVRVYAIVEVSTEDTTLVRVETAQGTTLESVVYTNCNCDCVDIYVAPDPE